jgi:hypothetical protein
MFWHDDSISKGTPIGSNLLLCLLEVAASRDALSRGGVVEKSRLQDNIILVI